MCILMLLHCLLPGPRRLEKLLEHTGGLLTWSSQVLPTNRNMTAVKKRWVSFHSLHKPNFGLKSKLNSSAKLQISIKPIILSAICLFLPNFYFGIRIKTNSSKPATNPQPNITDTILIQTFEHQSLLFLQNC